MINRTLYLLKDLLFCQVCQEPLIGRVAPNGYRIYVCEASVACRDGDTCDHATLIKASIIERQVLDAIRLLLADPWHIADIWHGLQARTNNDECHEQDARIEPQLAPGSQPALPEIALDEFTARTRHALTARDFQTRRDLVTFFIQSIIVSDNALQIEYVAPLHKYGRLARTKDDFWGIVRLKQTQLRWSFSRQRLSNLVQESLNDLSRLFRWWFPTLYLGWLAFSGLLIAVGYIHIGLILDSLLIIFLLYLTGYMPSGNESRLAWVSALPPILRVLSYSVPVPDVSLVLQLMLIGVPALTATLIMMHTLQQPFSAYGITLRNFPAQVAIIPLCLLIALLEWRLFEPQLAPIYAELANVEKRAFIALFITAVTEELVFRGLLQQGALAVYGHDDYWGTGLIFANIAFASMHIGYGPIAIVFSFCVGLLYGILSHRTGSIFGVLGAHGVSSVLLLLLLS